MQNSSRFMAMTKHLRNYGTGPKITKFFYGKKVQSRFRNITRLGFQSRDCILRNWDHNPVKFLLNYGTNSVKIFLREFRNFFVKSYNPVNKLWEWYRKSSNPVKIMESGLDFYAIFTGLELYGTSSIIFAELQIPVKISFKEFRKNYP